MNMTDISDAANRQVSAFNATSALSDSTYNGVPKRIFDIVLSLLLLPMLLPLIAVIWAVVRTEGAAGFFGHRRIGQDGKAFKCWKIRTMVPDAEERLQALLASDAEARAEWELDRKLRNDPRITRFGAFLRKSSLDELPQIWNVLRGEMSLIGPRPVTEDELERYGSCKHVYTAMRPGVTGLWQVSGRNDVSYAERVALDVAYHKAISLRTDLRVLVQTVGAVLNRTGC